MEFPPQILAENDSAKWEPKRKGVKKGDGAEAAESCAA